MTLDFSSPESLEGVWADSLKGGIAVLGGVHGNEPLGTAVVDHLFAVDESVYPLIANVPAVFARKRFKHRELSEAGADPLSRLYEPRRFKEIVDFCNMFPLTIDIHNSLAADYAFTGPDPEPGLLKVAAFFGRQRILLTDIKFNKAVPRALGLEYARPTNPQELALWLERKAPEVCGLLGKLATYDAFSELPEVDWESFEFYKTWQNISHDEAHKLALSDYFMHPFQALPTRLTTDLGREPDQPPLHALFWNGLCHGSGIFAGLAERSGPPPKVQRMLETLSL
jgi:hypothetical protein